MTKGIFSTEGFEKEIEELWMEKDKKLVRFSWCKYCSDSGCDNPEFHEKQLMKFAYERTSQRLKAEVSKIIGKCKKYYNHDMTQIELKELKKKLGLI